MAHITARHGVFTETRLRVDDTGGAGRPVVLIHGWPLSGASWSEQVPVLREAGYRVITYDRRGFGDSSKTLAGYGYDSLTRDLSTLLEQLDLRDVTLVGFSMGGGEVARFFDAGDVSRIRSVVFASAVPPFLAKVPGNPDGPLEVAEEVRMTAELTADAPGFFDAFVTRFFSADGVLVVSEEQRRRALALTEQADKNAALQTMAAFGNTDFREDLEKIAVPTLVIHGDKDAIVPFEGSGARIHAAIAGSELHVIEGGPHGVPVSHAEEFNRVLLEFLADPV